MKKCFKCGVKKELSEFYKHKQMKDGHVNKCKKCNMLDVRKNREDNIEYYRNYDRARGNRQTKEYIDNYNKNNPEKYKARNMVNNAIRDGKLIKLPCEVCGTMDRLHAHHDNYSEPLNVRWLCAAHHRQWHIKNK